jgi:superfamily II DNA or RNA helicase
MPDRERLLREIAAEEVRLASLADRAAAGRARLKALRDQLIAGESEGVPPSELNPSAESRAPETSAEKVALFRSLFRGRTDVFSRRWANPKTGRSGYAPACANEWVRGICEKPRVRCGECPHQAFLPITDAEILGHLQGRHVLGFYPLLRDETCWLLAVDFDKDSWREDASAFAGTCRSYDLAVAIERSRSGNGAHVWFFFESPVAAATARRLGCALLTETMARRHELSMSSYDRLFPNQDTLPRGGFGNLIALPLQLEARRNGNTVFLDDSLVPHEDQWSHLAGLARISAKRIDEITEDAAREGRVIGVRMPATDDEEAAPWTRPPSGRPRQLAVTGPLPPEVRVVVAQRLFVEKAGLPSSLLHLIKRLGAFQNPEFYKKQNLRLSTALTPRVIACADEHAGHVSLPRGCVDDLSSLLAEHGIGLVVEDQRELGQQVIHQFRGDLTPAQEKAAQALLAHDLGVFVAPPGVGKTVVGTHLIAARSRATLVLVHRKPLLEQWVAQLSLFLGVPSSEIGQIGGGRSRPNGRLDVAMLQSLVHKGAVDDIVASYGHVIVDECHHVPASTFERVLNEVRARFVTGLTATPHRRDGQHPILHMQCGPVRFAVDPRSPLARRPFGRRLICRETTFQPGPESEVGIQRLYAQIAIDRDRNALILADVRASLGEGRSPIVLTERKDHLELLAEGLRGVACHVIVLHGGMLPKARREAAERLAEIPADEPRLLLATGRYIGEGFDDPRLDTLFLALPVSWRGTLVQYAGRLHRLHPGKAEVRIYDYVDRRVPLLARMWERRLRGYRAIGYEARDELPLRGSADRVR